MTEEKEKAFLAGYDTKSRRDRTPPFFRTDADYRQFGQNMRRALDAFSYPDPVNARNTGIQLHDVSTDDHSDIWEVRIDQVCVFCGTGNECIAWVAGHAYARCTP